MITNIFLRTYNWCTWWWLSVLAHMYPAILSMWTNTWSIEALWIYVDSVGRKIGRIIHLNFLYCWLHLLEHSFGIPISIVFTRMYISSSCLIWKEFAVENIYVIFVTFYTKDVIYGISKFIFSVLLSCTTVGITGGCIKSSHTIFVSYFDNSEGENGWQDGKRLLRIICSLSSSSWLLKRWICRSTLTGNERNLTNFWIRYLNEIQACLILRIKQACICC